MPPPLPLQPTPTLLKGATGEVQALHWRRPALGAAPGHLARAAAARGAVGAAAAAAGAAVGAAGAAGCLGGRRVWREAVQEAGLGEHQVAALPAAHAAVPPLHGTLPAGGAAVLFIKHAPIGSSKLHAPTRPQHAEAHAGGATLPPRQAMCAGWLAGYLPDPSPTAPRHPGSPHNLGAAQQLGADLVHSLSLPHRQRLGTAGGQGGDQEPAVDAEERCQGARLFPAARLPAHVRAGLGSSRWALGCCTGTGGHSWPAAAGWLGWLGPGARRTRLCTLLAAVSVKASRSASASTSPSSACSCPAMP